MSHGHGHSTCECGGAFELTASETIHFARRGCSSCGRFAGWCRLPVKMTTVELIVELDRLDALLKARGLESARVQTLSKLVKRSRRYRDAIPAPYQSLLRAAVIAARDGGSQALVMAAQWPLARLEAHGTWPVARERDLATVRPGRMAPLFDLFGEALPRQAP